MLSKAHLYKVKYTKTIRSNIIVNVSLKVSWKFQDKNNTSNAQCGQEIENIYNVVK